MNHNAALKLISDIKGMPIWEIVIGVSGIIINFGGKFYYGIPNYGLRVDGEISMWITCNATIKQEGTLIHRALYPQEKEEEEIFQRYFKDKIVNDFIFREENNSVHFLVESNYILSAYPTIKDKKKCWSVHDNRVGNPHGYVFYQDVIDLA